MICVCLTLLQVPFDDGQWYDGIIDQVRPRAGSGNTSSVQVQVHIKYDDGDDGWEDWVDGSGGQKTGDGVAESEAAGGNHHHHHQQQLIQFIEMDPQTQSL
jgi:hypothetical protein